MQEYLHLAQYFKIISELLMALGVILCFRKKGHKQHSHNLDTVIKS